MKEETGTTKRSLPLRIRKSKTRKKITRKLYKNNNNN